MSARTPDFEVERFERVAAGGTTVLLRVEGRWWAASHVRLSSPMLLLDDGRDRRRVAALRGPENVAPVAGPDPPSWRAAFAVPATLLTNDLMFALETSRGTVALPPPNEAITRVDERRHAMIALEQRLAAVQAELAQGNEATRVATAGDEQSARALELAGAVERERDQAIVAARAAARRGERTKARMGALERELDELRRQADAAATAERQVGDLRARIAELEKARRALAAMADRVPGSEDAPEAAAGPGGEVADRAERISAELVALREENARALQDATMLEQSQAEARRLVAGVAELERVGEQRERAAADQLKRAKRRAVALERELDAVRAATRAAGRAERQIGDPSARAAELEATRRALTEAAGRVRELERALEVAQARRSEVEERAERTRAQLDALCEENAREAARLDQAHAAAERRAAVLEAALAQGAAAEQRVKESRDVARPAGLASTARAQRGARAAELEHDGDGLTERAAIAGFAPASASPRPREKQTAAALLRGAPVLTLLLVAVPVGIIAGIQPVLAVGLVGAAVVTALAFFAPVVHLGLLIAVTAIVPYEWQQMVEFGLGGPGLQVVDLLLMTGLARAAIVLARRPPRGISVVVSALMLVFMAVVLAQGVHGWLAGHVTSQVVYETRELLTWGTLLIALPILMDPQRRRQLLAAAMVIGLLVGLWGIAQWIFEIPFGEAGDAGVQAGVALTSGGRGQVQGALFAFPVALLISVAVLMAGQAKSGPARALLMAIVLTNALSLLLTFERSLWVASVAGVLFIVLRSRPVNRLQAIITTALVVMLALPVLATVAPGTLTTARERLLSLGQYGSDSSVRFRIDESRFVVDRIAEHPVLGSGMGATIHWGRPYDRVPAASTPFAHNSVLWLSWKVGVPGTLVLLVMIACAFLVPRRREEDATTVAVRHGAQAALLAMVIISVTFQSLASRPITPTLGLVLALCVVSTGAGARPNAARAKRAEALQYA